jgi:MFS family permease
VADRHDRRRVMFAAQSCMAAFSAALAILTVQGRTSLAVLYGLNAAGAAASAFDNPARQALVPRLVLRARCRALSLNLAMFHAAMIGGPGIAGLVLAAGSRGLGSVAAVYAFNAFSFLGVLAALALMRTSGRSVADAAPERPWEALKAGLRFVFTTPLMVWTTGLDFVARSSRARSRCCPSSRTRSCTWAPRAMAGWWPHPRWARWWDRSTRRWCRSRAGRAACSSGP